MRARGIIVLAKSNQLVKNIATKQLSQNPLFAAKNPALFATSGLYKITEIVRVI